MNDRERQMLYQMISMARANLIRMGRATVADRSVRLMDYVDEASRILKALEDIYGPRAGQEESCSH